MIKSIELNPPMMPNFITMKMPIRNRQDGFVEAPKISVADLSENEAMGYAELMKQTFIKHWQDKKNKPVSAQ